MFDRFWRKDAARGGGRNVGLGLSIVRAFSDLLEYDLETQLRTDGLLRITLSERQVLSQLDQPFG
jgi:signal transduction histidine kinase